LHHPAPDLTRLCQDRRVHVIVVGCGRVGSGLAVGLDRDGHSVAIIDKNQAAFRRLPSEWSGRVVHGFGFDRDHLEAAGVREAGALAAVTSGDNSNILAARIARETYQVPRVVARIYDPRRAVIYQRLGIPTVATVTWTTDQVMRRLFEDEAVTEWSEPSGHVVLVERGLPDSWAGRTLRTLAVNDRFRLVSLTRAGQAQVATGELVGQEGDILHIAVRKDDLDALSSFLANPPPAAGR
jgi:trk system potassium uptake protein TrkA